MTAICAEAKAENYKKQQLPYRQLLFFFEHIEGFIKPYHKQF
jgi:hypothetical protein